MKRTISRSAMGNRFLFIAEMKKAILAETQKTISAKKKIIPISVKWDVNYTFTINLPKETGIDGDGNIIPVPGTKWVSRRATPQEIREYETLQCGYIEVTIEVTMDSFETAKSKKEYIEKAKKYLAWHTDINDWIKKNPW